MEYKNSIQTRIDSGKYTNVSEVLRAGLRALDEVEAKTDVLSKFNKFLNESRDSGDINESINDITKAFLASKK